MRLLNSKELAYLQNNLPEGFAIREIVNEFTNKFGYRLLVIVNWPSDHKEKTLTGKPYRQWELLKSQIYRQRYKRD